MKPIMYLVLAIGMLVVDTALAANNKESGSAKAISKLQMMVKEATTERDKLKSENAKIVGELEEVKKQLELEKSAALAVGDKLNAELAAQKSSADETRGRLENTASKLREVVDKFNALNKSKNELAAEQAKLMNDQQVTVSQLKTCEAKNEKMFEASKEIIGGYKSCQNKGIVDTLIDSEPVLKFSDVEFETIIQEYEDKLNKQKYQSRAEQKK